MELPGTVARSIVRSQNDGLPSSVKTSPNSLITMCVELLGSLLTILTMQLLKSVLENCVFTFQDKFFKQLHGAAMGSPCSPVDANIYMEYFENLALGPELPVPVKDWKRYVDDVFSIIPKDNRNKMLQYLNSINPHIQFTI